MVNIVSGVRKASAILLPKKHIFLLSHMRAYTSLFGHIMGSNPAICGYYEMHIGYHSWKSPIRQKLLYFRHEEAKPGFSYMFDKVLHNEHDVALDVLNNRRSRTIFCLRQPQDVIPSILKLYGGIDPSHEFNSEAFSTQYYISRLAMLESLAKSMDSGFFYFDSDSIKQQSDECLGNLSDWLQLHTPLSDTYTLQQNTSRERYGDSSEAISTGRIRKNTSHYEAWPVNQDLMGNTYKEYCKVRKTLIELSARNSVAQLALPRTSNNSV
jgi:hypothetical protein